MEVGTKLKVRMKLEVGPMGPSPLGGHVPPNRQTEWKTLGSSLSKVFNSFHFCLCQVCLDFDKSRTACSAHVGFSCSMEVLTVTFYWERGQNPYLGQIVELSSACMSSCIALGCQTVA